MGSDIDKRRIVRSSVERMFQTDTPVELCQMALTPKRTVRSHQRPPVCVLLGTLIHFSELFPRLQNTCETMYPINSASHSICKISLPLGHQVEALYSYAVDVRMWDVSCL